MLKEQVLKVVSDVETCVCQGSLCARHTRHIRLDHIRYILYWILNQDFNPKFTKFRKY